jgi:peptidoglycan-associated lipoprotein
MKHIVYVAVLAAILAGCADKPTKDAVIEDRGLRTQSAASGAGGVDTQGVGTAAIDSRVISGGGASATENRATGTSPIAGTDTKQSSVLETRPLAEASTEVKPLADAQAASGASAGADGAAADANGQGPISLNLKDPKSPLAKRVIHFDYDSAAIRDEYRELLEAHSQYLIQNTRAKAILQGHADERGSREYNIALGQRRAESVANALNLLGVPELQVEAVSMGEEKPLVEGQDEAAWQQNRRAEIYYPGE